MISQRNLWIGLGALLMGGCTAGIGIEDQGMFGENQAYKPEFKINAAGAGVKVDPPTENDQAWRQAAVSTASRYGGARSNPFGLTSSERVIEAQQDTARLFANLGGFSVQFTPPAPAAATPPPVIETQPYRRLSGIIVGDSVMALIEMGNGQTEIIRPGMRIPNSPWRVKSIDSNKAVLERSGNVLPKQITVRLESPPPGMQQTTPGVGGPPGGFPGGPPGGFPGGPPGGFPGGPPGGFPGGRPGGMGPGGMPGGFSDQ